MFNVHFFDTLLGIVENIENYRLQYAVAFIIGNLRHREKYFFENKKFRYDCGNTEWWREYFESGRDEAYNQLFGVFVVAEYDTDDKKTINFLLDLLLKYRWNSHTYPNC